MLNRIPGFCSTTAPRCAAERGGNVLIDGQRPASKADSLQDILFRIPASKVERIDIIRGGAPGIDMQGKTVLANVIRKKDGGLRGVLAVADNHVGDGRDLGQIRLEGSGALGDVKWELSGRTGRGLDDGNSAGRGVRFAPSIADRTTYDGEATASGTASAPSGRCTEARSAEQADQHRNFKGETSQVLRRDSERTSSCRTRTRPRSAATPAVRRDWDVEMIGLRTTRDRRVAASSPTVQPACSSSTATRSRPSGAAR